MRPSCCRGTPDKARETETVISCPERQLMSARVRAVHLPRAPGSLVAIYACLNLLRYLARLVGTRASDGRLSEGRLSLPAQGKRAPVLVTPKAYRTRRSPASVDPRLETRGGPIFPHLHPHRARRCQHLLFGPFRLAAVDVASRRVAVRLASAWPVTLGENASQPWRRTWQTDSPSILHI